MTAPAPSPAEAAIIDDPVHRRAKWMRPIAYSSSVANPPPWPRPVVLRSSCGHVLGVGILGQRQRYVAWKKCTR